MIYSHKPQRSGRSIASNTNNPPQDPPPNKAIIWKFYHKKQEPETLLTETLPTTEVFILIEDTVPSVPEVEFSQNEKFKDTVLPETKLPTETKLLTDKKLEDMTDTKLTGTIHFEETFQKVSERKSVWRKLYNKIKKLCNISWKFLREK